MAAAVGGGGGHGGGGHGGGARAPSSASSKHVFERPLATRDGTLVPMSLPKSRALERSGSSHWDDPKNEMANLAAIEAAVLAVGGPKLIFYIARSQNRNTVLYVYDGVAIRVFTLVLDTDARREAGLDPSDTTTVLKRPLTAEEEPWYGVTTSVREHRTYVHFKALEAAPEFKSLPIQLVLDGAGLPALMADVDPAKPEARLTCAYVQFAKSMLPSPDTVTIYGTNKDLTVARKCVEVD